MGVKALRLELEFTAAAIKEADLKGKVLVVFDVLRATSTIIAALEKDCAGIIPVVSVEEAWLKYRELKKRNPHVLVGGEIHGKRVQGMDLGNSPVEYLAADLAGKMVVLSTSNGTRAIRNGSLADSILIGSLLNARAVAHRLLREGKDVVFGCSGRLGEFSLEDFSAAGAVSFFLRQELPETEATDRVMAAEACFSQGKDNLGDFLRGGKHGRYLEGIGFHGDIDYCTQLNASQLVPEFRGGKVAIYQE